MKQGLPTRSVAVAKVRSDNESPRTRRGQTARSLARIHGKIPRPVAAARKNVIAVPTRTHRALAILAAHLARRRRDRDAMRESESYFGPCELKRPSLCLAAPMPGSPVPMTAPGPRCSRPPAATALRATACPSRWPVAGCCRPAAAASPAR